MARRGARLLIIQFLQIRSPLLNITVQVLEPNHLPFRLVSFGLPPLDLIHISLQWQSYRDSQNPWTLTVGPGFVGSTYGTAPSRCFAFINLVFLSPAVSSLKLQAKVWRTLSLMDLCVYLVIDRLLHTKYINIPIGLARGLRIATRTWL